MMKKKKNKNEKVETKTVEPHKIESKKTESTKMENAKIGNQTSKNGQEKIPLRSISGYYFGSERDAKMAQKEREKAEYLEKRMDYSKPEEVMTIYNKAIENRIFQTPVGYDYLKKIQSYLMEMNIGTVKDIPLYNIFSNNLNDTPATEKIVKKKISSARQNELKSKLRFSMFLNILLALMVIAMFVIAWKGSTPNIINYQTALENKYASWEEELTKREDAVREKERELNIVIKDNNKK